MSKKITRIVLTGGPAAGKTTLISRILKEFKQENGWRVITIPETATELISGFGLGPFEGCMSMDEFQYFVIGDQLHKEELALKGAEVVPQEKIMIVYDRAVFDDLAYMKREKFDEILAAFNTNEEKVLAGYDAVLHLVSCANGAEFAYNFGNEARYETIEVARQRDEDTLAAWSQHKNHYVIDNPIDFEEKINKAISVIYDILGEKSPGARGEVTQTYLAKTIPNVERKVRRQKSGNGFLYFYAEKRTDEHGRKWVTEKPISEKEYDKYLREA